MLIECGHGVSIGVATAFPFLLLAIDTVEVKVRLFGELWIAIVVSLRTLLELVDVKEQFLAVAIVTSSTRVVVGKDNEILYM